MVRFCPKGSSMWSAVSEISHVTHWQNPSKTKNQSPSFSSFNHDGQLKRRAVDKITPTQTTKPSLQRIASSPSFYCHSLSLCLYSPSLYFLCRSISLFPSAISLKSRINHAGVFPVPYKENLGAKTWVIRPEQIGMRSAVETQSQRIGP